MLADFFFEKVKKLLSVVAVVLLGATSIYAVQLGQAEQIVSGLTFYVVSVSDGGAEACIQQVTLDGGAGYLIEDKVALAAYFSLEDAQKVAKNAAKQYDFVKVLTLHPDEIIVLSAKKVKIERMLKSVYGHICAIADVAILLDEGETQEKAKATLACIGQSLDTLSKTYQDEPSTVVFCRDLESWIQEIGKDVLFSQAIRYKVCALAEDFCRLVSAQGI